MAMQDALMSMLGIDPSQITKFASGIEAAVKEIEARLTSIDTRLAALEKSVAVVVTAVTQPEGEKPNDPK